MIHSMHSCELSCPVPAMLVPDAAGGFYPFPLREEPGVPQVRRKDPVTAVALRPGSPHLFQPIHAMEAAA